MAGEPLIPTSVPVCRVCGNPRQTRIGILPLYLPIGEAPSDLLRCKQCGSWSRSLDFDDPRIRAHFDVTSYTDPEREEIMRSARADFFRRIVNLATSSIHTPPSQQRVLDVGVAYGHLLDLYHAEGATCAAIEIVDFLRERLRDRGYDAYETVQDIPVGELFDVITSIDSLYYFEKPAELLRALHPHLKSEGVLILRVANRTPVLRLLHALRWPGLGRVFGDTKHNFSYRGIRSLLERSGFRIERVILSELRRKIATIPRRLYYRSSLIVSRTTGLKLTPGIILVCRRGDPAK
jgi:2-polyprenyl-3-methyl-5-hydroxy-6-metoxy-1,4-benzoquinol methylase